MNINFSKSIKAIILLLGVAILSIGTASAQYTGGSADGYTSAGTTFSFPVVAIETLQQKGISIYPNPTSGIVNFDFSNLEVQKISISDMTGKVIIEKTVTNQIENIDFSNNAYGLYLIKLQTDKEVFTTKIIKK